MDIDNGIGSILTSDLINAKNKSTDTSVKNGSTNFADLLKNELEETNELQHEAENAAVDISTGNVKDLHRANIAIEKAEMKMKLMLEVRNKAISAYKELTKMQL